MRKILVYIAALAASCALKAAPDVKSSQNGECASVSKEGVFVDGKPFRLLSGEVHYFRIMPEYWRDSLEKLRACGLNTVSTYCPWNSHEPSPGKYDFSGILDLGKFLKTAQETGLKVMLRPGPYICSEWDFGGLPPWLNNIDGVRLRSLNPQYMNAAAAYFKRILKESEPYFCNNGGPIVAVQIENGYASFGNDAAYIEKLRDIVRESGFKGIIYTSDGDSDIRINAVAPEGVWRTLMTGTCLEKGIEVMKQTQPETPQMISEFWVGQGLRSGKPMRHRDIEKMSEELDAVLAGGGHVCCYMFHGGTNFGFMSGAMRSRPGCFVVNVSSYDVDAVLNEAGDTTPKYDAFRKVFLKYNPEAAKYDVPKNSIKKAYGEIKFTEAASFWDNISNLSEKTAKSAYPLTMEEMGSYYGFINYRTRMAPQSFPMPLKIEGLRDRAWIRMDGKIIAVFTQNDANPECVLDIPKNGADLDILVENMGRVNFGLTIVDNKKGITGGVVLNKNQQFQNNWTVDSLPLKSLKKIAWKKISDGVNADYPAFFKGDFEAQSPEHTYIKVSGVRGYLWVNGFLLGRYESTGPVVTSYIPAALLKKGKNTVEILELEKMNGFSAESLDKPIMIRRKN